MVSGKQMGKGLTDGMNILKTLVVGLGAVILSAVIVLITVGVVTDTVADGNIPISSALNTSVTDLETTVDTNVDTALTNLPLIFGILALVIVLAVIGWLVFGRGGRSSGADF